MGLVHGNLRVVAAAIALAIGSSCVTVGGKMYPGWQKNAVKVSYEAAGGESGAAVLRIRVLDGDAGVADPPLTVEAQRADDPTLPKVVLRGDTNPASFDELPAGRWDLKIDTASAGEPVRCTVDLQAKRVCNVEVVILERHELMAAAG